VIKIFKKKQSEPQQEENRQFENYEQFLNRTGRENNTESLRIFMVEHDLP
jgi:hypothetical protein